MDRDHVNKIEHAMAAQQLHEIGIDRGKSAQDDGQFWINPANLARRGNRHARKNLPVRIGLKIPMRKIVRFIPQHHCFNHSCLPVSQCAFQFAIQNVAPIAHDGRGTANPGLRFRVRFNL